MSKQKKKFFFSFLLLSILWQSILYMVWHGIISKLRNYIHPIIMNIIFDLTWIITFLALLSHITHVFTPNIVYGIITSKLSPNAYKSQHYNSKFSLSKIWCTLGSQYYAMNLYCRRRRHRRRSNRFAFIAHICIQSIV